MSLFLAALYGWLFSGSAASGDKVNSPEKNCLADNFSAGGCTGDFQATGRMPREREVSTNSLQYGDGERERERCSSSFSTVAVVQGRVPNWQMQGKSHGLSLSPCVLLSLQTPETFRTFSSNLLHNLSTLCPPSALSSMAPTGALWHAGLAEYYGHDERSSASRPPIPSGAARVLARICRASAAWAWLTRLTACR